MTKNLYIFGAGNGAQIVIKAVAEMNDELKAAGVPPGVSVAGVLDDDKSTWGGMLCVATYGDMVQVEIRGGIDFIHNHYIANVMLVCSSSNISFRKKCMDMHPPHEWEWLNICRSEFNGDNMGEGNIIFPDVHTDYLVEIGNNNVISAGTVICHHSVIGDTNLFGPGCLLSGSVTIGSGCRFGSGIVFKPNVTVGDNVDIASGTVVISDIPDNTAIRAKTKLGSPVYGAERIVSKKEVPND